MTNRPSLIPTPDEDTRQLVLSFYDALSHLITDQRPVRRRYADLYRRFVELLYAATASSGLIFSGPFARMQYLCSAAGISSPAAARLNAFRVRCRHQSTLTDEHLERHFLSDLRPVAGFAEAIFGIPVPPVLTARMPLTEPPAEAQRPTHASLRLTVTGTDTARAEISALPVGNLERPVLLQLSPGEGRPDRTYLLPLLREGSQLNAVRPTGTEGSLEAELLVLEPDYLMDISAIADAFEPYGETPLSALLKKIQPTASSQAILLGNLAGQLLDETIHTAGREPIPYAESVRRFFSRNPLAVATCPDLGADFHRQAREQSQNLRQIIGSLFKEDTRINLEKLLLEPSFFSEMLGLQGRMDLLQSDCSVLMEQKSGKRAFRSRGHVEKHYVQMLLYQAVLHYNYGIRNSQMSSYLLYSKYPDGLIRETSAPALLFRAMKLRNEIVAQEYALAMDGGAGTLFALTPEMFNPKKLTDRLWTEYRRPALERLLQPMQSADSVTLMYVKRFMTFVQREQIMAKVGSSGRDAAGQAALWTLTLQEKVETGLIYDRLQIASLLPSEQGDGIGGIVLTLPDDPSSALPNFREGDIVVLYPYACGEEPDVRRTLALRCTLVRLEPDRLTLQLRAPQRSEEMFRPAGKRLWAVEHDCMDASFRSAFRGLYSLLRATPQRLDLLLGRCAPRRDTTLTLSADYSDHGRNPQFNDLVLRSRQALDYFLLVGPPGTGKTSFGLMYMLREALAVPRASVLLSAYTNRAVDEICGKLVKAGLDFVRIGSEPACEERYRPYLLTNRQKQCSTAADVRALIRGTRILAGTVAALTAADGLFALKRFSVAIIDEASQILEPQIMGLLCAKSGERDAIERFILIGDHKQLPAVVLQSPGESAVSEPELRALGLTDCRRSLFERLLSLNAQPRSPFRFTFSKQGRMHPAVAQFANRAFYGGKLSPIPLEHQRQDTWLNCAESHGLSRLLAKNRLVFIDSPLPDRTSPDKVNAPEARRIALVTQALLRLYDACGRTFSPQESLGIIVPYRNQIVMVRHELQRLHEPRLNGLAIDTVERYQGSEREVIIYGFTVRRSHQLHLLCSQSFTEEGRTIDRKLNVALTRAREQLVLVGNAALLGSNKMFHSLLTHCKGHGVFISQKEFEEEQ